MGREGEQEGREEEEEYCAWLRVVVSEAIALVVAYAR